MKGEEGRFMCLEKKQTSKLKSKKKIAKKVGIFGSKRAKYWDVKPWRTQLLVECEYKNWENKPNLKITS